MPYLKSNERGGWRYNGGVTVHLFFTALPLIVGIALSSTCPVFQPGRSEDLCQWLCTTLWLRRISPRYCCPGSGSRSPWDRRVSAAEGKDEVQCLCPSWHNSLWEILLLIVSQNISRRAASYHFSRVRTAWEISLLIIFSDRASLLFFFSPLLSSTPGHCQKRTQGSSQTWTWKHSFLLASTSHWTAELSFC